MADDEGSEGYECPSCGASVEPDWKACPSCGVEFSGEEAEAAPPTPPPAAARSPPTAAAPPPSAPEAPAPAPLPRAAAAAKAPPAPPPRAPAPKAPPASKKKDKAPPREKKAREAKAARRRLIGRTGVLGFVGIVVLVVGLFSFFVAYNWDTIIAGQSENQIGPIQQNGMMVAAAVAGGGAVLAFLGLVRARPAAGARDLEDIGTEVKAPAPLATAVLEEPAEGPAPEPKFTAYEPPARGAPVEMPAAPVAFVAPAAAVRAQDEEEEEAEIDLAPPAEPVQAPVAAAVAAPTPSPAQAEKDELEDLFGELESETAAAPDEEVHYECPNCHGIVREDDTVCPHCQVTFEG